MSFLSRLFGGEARRLYRAGMRAFEAGRDREALRCFEGAVAAGSPPGHPIAHLAGFYAAEAAQRLGVAALAHGESARARELFQQACTWQPRSPVLLEHAAVAALACDLAPECRDAAQAALDLQPGRRGALLLLATSQCLLGEADLAKAILDAVRAQPPGGRLATSVHRALSARAPSVPGLATLLEALVPAPSSSRL